MVGTIIEMVAHVGIVVGEDRTQVESVKKMQRHSLDSRHTGVRRLVLPLLVIIETVVGIAAVARCPVFAGSIVSRPVQPPEQVARLHEIVVARSARIVVATLSDTRQTDVCREVEKLSDLLREVHAA